MLSLYQQLCELPQPLTRQKERASALERAKPRLQLIPHHLLGLKEGIGQKLVVLKPLADSSISRKSI